MYVGAVVLVGVFYKRFLIFKPLIIATSFIFLGVLRCQKNVRTPFSLIGLKYKNRLLTCD